MSRMAKVRYSTAVIMNADVVETVGEETSPYIDQYSSLGRRRPHILTCPARWGGDVPIY